MEYEPVIGIEVHTELATRTKMFCDCLNDPNEKEPNKNICPVCLAHPGTLPVPNKDAIEKVILTGMALRAEIPSFSQFDRKNYFYPDLPKGYQISQYEFPLVKGGYLEFALADGSIRHIRITRVHLEEDTGRLQHDAAGSTLVDFNRAGIPLMELVTEPDIKSAEEVRRFAEELQLLVRYLGVSNADMEKGEMRIEANVSVRPKGATAFGAKVELKNINSFKFAEKAAEFEIARQIKMLEAGGEVIQETRGWDDAKGTTFSQRIKEGATDYRYFPEPDIPPLVLDQPWLAAIRARLTELPRQKRARFTEEYGLDAKTAELFVREPALAAYLEKVVSEMEEWIASMGDRADRGKTVKLVANYLSVDLQSLLKNSGTALKDLKISAENFGELTAMIYEEKISSAAAKTILEEMFLTGADPSDILRDKNLAQESSPEALRELARRIISENHDMAASVRGGKANVIQALIGKAMQVSGGKANPAVLRVLFEAELGGEPRPVAGSSL